MEVKIVIMITIVPCTIASSSSAGIIMTIMMKRCSIILIWIFWWYWWKGAALFWFEYFDDNDGKVLHYLVHLLKSSPHFISSLRFDSFSPYSPKVTSFITASFTPPSPFLCGNVLKEIWNIRQNRNHFFTFIAPLLCWGISF